MEESKKELENLQFKNDNPGAVQYGNFINYYKFHPPENRINMLPRDIWSNEGPFVVLDIGCNAGDLTIALYNFLKACCSSNKCYILGIDIDPILIERAQEQNNDNNVVFHNLDFMNVTERRNVFTQYLTKYNVQKFSAVFCFSVTMWIHLNHGDSGLRMFLKDICDISSMLIIEPQPWKCYNSAVRRLQLAYTKFDHFKDLKIRNDVEAQIEHLILQLDGTSKIFESAKTKWERKIIIFKID